MKNKFDFYEVVTVIGAASEQLSEIDGEQGTVLGMSQDEETGTWGYAISITSSGEVWDVDESQLKSTGEKKSRDDFYSGDSIQVKVDPVSGEGSLD